MKPPRLDTLPIRAYALGEAATSGLTMGQILTAKLSARLIRHVWHPSVNYWHADEIACRLGVHPTAIWPMFDRLDWSGGGEEVAA